MAGQEAQVALRPKWEDAEEIVIDKDLKLRMHFDDLTHPAVTTFLATIDATSILQNATRQVHRHLYKQHGKPPGVRSITLVLREMDGVAYTTGIRLDDMHKEIHLSLEYIMHKKDDPPAFAHETTGVIVHEMVHCWQHNCRGTAPGGLIEGIADYVRLKSGLAPPHWKKTREEAGKKWDEGYQKTAWFLEWLEDRHGSGSISRMNEYMQLRKYDEEKFWNDLFNDNVQSLWKKYMAHWDEPKSMPDVPGKQAKHFNA